MLETTVIGSFKKPDYVKIPCWVGTDNKAVFSYGELYNKIKKENNAEDLEEEVKLAIAEIISFQEEVGITVITDGEIRRDFYTNEYMRSLSGFDFQNLKRTLYRNGACVDTLPRIISKVDIKENRDSLIYEWSYAQSLSKKAAIKFTLPGPLTIIGTACNEFYNDTRELAQDLAKCLNKDILKLTEAGCKYVQIDDCCLVRDATVALDYGIDCLQLCFDGVPEDVKKIVHICCGYPQYLDQTDYLKADKNCYQDIAEKLDQVGLDQISIEDAHRRNDLELFKKFQRTTIVLGVIDVISSRIESVDEIKEHISNVLTVIPKERLVIAPDCGLVFLPHDIMKAKLRNMVEAAKSFQNL